MKENELLEKKDLNKIKDKTILQSMMNSFNEKYGLVVDENENITTNSLKVASLYGKEHKNVIVKIKDFIKEIPELEEKHFKLSSYIDKQYREQPMYVMDSQGLKLIIDRTRKTNNTYKILDLYNKMSNGTEKYILTERFETTFFNKLIDILEPLNINIELQKPMFDNKYRIDGYIEDYNLAIEYDESQHFVEPQKSEDIIRQQEIEDELGCKFLRLNYQDTDAYNIGLVIKNILNEKMVV